MNKLYTVGGFGDFYLAMLGVETIIKYELYTDFTWIIFTHAPINQIAYLATYYKSFIRKNNLNIKLEIEIHPLEATNQFDFSQCLFGDAKSYLFEDQRFELIDMVKHANDPTTFNILVHPFGSEFSADYLRKIGRPSKTIEPTAFLNKWNLSIPQQGIKNTYIEIIGSKKEFGFETITTAAFSGAIKNYPSWYNQIYFDDILDPLYIIQNINKYDLIIAADSSIKTLGLIEQIPTITIYSGDDPIRDEIFITPYINKPWAFFAKDTKEQNIDYTFINYTFKRKLDRNINV